MTEFSFIFCLFYTSSQVQRCFKISVTVTDARRIECVLSAVENKGPYFGMLQTNLRSVIILSDSKVVS